MEGTFIFKAYILICTKAMSGLAPSWRLKTITSSGSESEALNEGSDQVWGTKKCRQRIWRSTTGSLDPATFPIVQENWSFISCIIGSYGSKIDFHVIVISFLFLLSSSVCEWYWGILNALIEHMEQFVVNSCVMQLDSSHFTCHEPHHIEILRIGDF